MRKYALPCFLICLLLYSCQKSTLQEIDLRRLVDLDLAVLHLPEQDFQPFGSMFLEQTEGVAPQDVKQLVLFEDRVYVLYAHTLQSFDFGQGTLDFQFAIGREDWEIVDFDIDNLHRRIYAIDGKRHRLLCLDLQGQVQFEMVLTLEYEYCHLRVIDPEYLLLTVNSMPVAVTQIVNLPQKSLRTLEHPVKKSFTLNAEQVQSLKEVAPLYFFGRSREGVLAKYIFNDTIFRYTAQGKEPVFYIAMNSRKLQWKEGPDLFKDNNRAAMYGLWKIWDDQWFCKVRQTRRGLDKFRLVLCDTLITPYEKTHLDPPETRVIWENTHIYQYFWIYGTTDLFVDEDMRMFFTVVAYDPKRKTSWGEGEFMKLPDNIVNHPNKKELILCYYKLKDGAITHKKTF